MRTVEGKRAAQRARYRRKRRDPKWVAKERARGRAYYRNSPTGKPRQARWTLFNRYRLTPEELVKMTAEQAGRCLLCGEEKRLEIDHDHANGRIRGLLCHRCNIRLAGLEDAAWLKRALIYLGSVAVAA